VRGNIDNKVLWSVGFGCDACRPVRDQISSQNHCALTTVLGNVCDDEQSNHYQRCHRDLTGLQGQSTTILGRATRGSRQVSQPEHLPPHAMRSTRSVLIPNRRLIATYYLLDITANTYIPNTWEGRRLWQGRMVYTAIRDSLNIEKHLMFICQSWRRASKCFVTFYFLSFFLFVPCPFSHHFTRRRACCVSWGFFFSILCCALPFMFSSSYCSWNCARHCEFEAIKGPMSGCE